MQISIKKAQNGFIITTTVDRTDDDWPDGRTKSKMFIAKDEAEVATLVKEAFAAAPKEPQRPRRRL